MNRNIKLFYFYRAVADLLLLGPIIVVFILSKGLSFTEVMLLNSISSIALVVFEVPTGVIADRVGRKWSILIGAFFMAVSMILLAFAYNFYILAISEIVFSLGMALRSGADTALLYDTLLSLGRESEYKIIEGKTRSFIYYTQAVGSIVASFLYSIDAKLPAILSAVFMIITMGIAFLFKEPKLEIKEHHDNYLNHLKESGRFVWSHKKIRAVILFSSIFYIFYRGGFFYFQPYMQEVGIQVKYFGLIFFLFNVVAAFASKRVDKFMHYAKPYTLTVLFSFMSLSFLLMSFTPLWIGVLWMLPQQLARGFYKPVVFKYINKHTSSEKRATVLSFHNLLISLPAAAMYPLFGKLLDQKDIFSSHKVVFIFSALSLLGLFFFLKRELGKKEEN